MVRDYETGREFFIGDWKGGDTSVSGWQIQALTAAWYAGIRFEDRALEKAGVRARADIRSRVHRREGWCGYQGTSPLSGAKEVEERRARAYALTAIGALSLQLVGAGDSGEATSLLSTMTRYSFDWDRAAGGWQGAPLYAWYYATQAKFLAAGQEPRPMASPSWVRWNQQMTRTLIKKQNRDGSWGFPKLSREGTEHVEGDKNKPVYATALCCLMLEVYYRCPPLEGGE